MTASTNGEIRCHSRRLQDFGGFYVATILLSFHWSLVIYINSSFLEQFFSHFVVSALYTLGSALSIFFFLGISQFLRSKGNLRFIVNLALIEGVALFFLPFVSSPFIIAVLFLVHFITVPLILFCLDIFMEAMIGTCEGETGGRRGLLLTIISLTTALSALISGYLIGDSTPHYGFVYLTSTGLLIPFIFVVTRSFKKFRDEKYVDAGFLEGVQTFWRRKDIRNVFCAHFLLQLFFAWMVIYTPIYLHTIIGFDWKVIGEILFVGLLAYVFLEYIIGVIADNWIGEKEMMAFGFVITALATSWFAFLGPGEVTLWMLAMFMTRVGASFIETTTESYFFKHTNSNDTALISFFRITRPLSYLIGAVLGSLTLIVVPMNLLFIVLGFLLIPGLFFSIALHDSK
jgi:predicted MFS family arabinose efflux permease